jgi:hypothetical protein
VQCSLILVLLLVLLLPSAAITAARAAPAAEHMPVVRVGVLLPQRHCRYPSTNTMVSQGLGLTTLVLA